MPFFEGMRIFIPTLGTFGPLCCGVVMTRSVWASHPDAYGVGIEYTPKPSIA